jgi:hypothetical protein
MGLKMSKRTIDDCIDDVFDGIDFDDLIIWAKALEVEVEYPPLDDMWPDWKAELSVKVAEALLKAVQFNIHTDVCPTCKVERQLDELLAALKKYGQHSEECIAEKYPEAWHCICGLEHAISNCRVKK